MPRVSDPVLSNASARRGRFPWRSTNTRSPVGSSNSDTSLTIIADVQTITVTVELPQAWYKYCKPAQIRHLDNTQVG